MRRDPNFASILVGYRRIAIAVAVLVLFTIAIRLLAFFDLLGPRALAVMPAGALLIGLVMLGILIYGHRWLSRQLSSIAVQARHARDKSNRDALTGVYNRAFFLEALADDVFHGSERPVGYLQLDMDNLKVLNDSAGHAAGDAALVHLARTIETVIPGGVLGRLGGDEFGVIILGHDNKPALRRLGEELLRQLERPVNILGRSVRLSASIGVAMSPLDTVDPTDLISKADLALYTGKKNGRHAVVCFEPDMLGDERHRRFVERDLRAAIMMNELELHYQPVFGSDMQIRSHEALVRWRHQVRGMISPAQFVPIAEESDLIDKLGEWVLRRACADLGNLGGKPVAINVSPMQLRHSDFARRFAETLTELGTDPRLIIVEITETVPLNARAAELDNLKALRALGVRIAIDDFGAGHASLQYLRGFAFDIIKIDRSYVMNLGENRIDGMIVTAICDIARSLPVDVIAEGVETPEQLRQLRLAGCTGFQGFLLGRPQPLLKAEAVAA
ncbi:diguanylate cyclase (GGDEF) domain-containing protein [Devosia sp. YR412]|uniref:putative bifunctional diguanylate cyclase/phosphodiesterase n=1 Tax=Devosia sp. YR412 TaxID=1881030 RepID=UPI0008CEAF33|nr:GGDEF domain-containing phosphodiesterase [Devosia sp. YR412]SEQ28270.1 diguanylate cyclase (GGDEF) domain-containing protein [Devosia sp. YR412]